MSETSEEMRTLFEQWCEDQFGMSASEFIALDFDVRMALCEARGVQFSAIGHGMPEGGITHEGGEPKSIN